MALQVGGNSPPQSLKTPLVYNNLNSINKSSSIGSLRYLQRNKSSISKKLQKQARQSEVSIKEVFVNNRENLTLEELNEDEGYQVYYVIFRKIRFLILILGLWAPLADSSSSFKSNCFYWFLRNIYPYLIYLFILYPWTTFITQEAYSNVPVFLFITLHSSGFFAYRSARKYFKQNHLTNFITSTFIPFYDDLDEFKLRQNINDDDSYSDDDSNSDGDNYEQQRLQKRRNSGSYSTNSHVTLQMGFQQRYANDNKKRRRNVKQYHDYYVRDKKKKKDKEFDLQQSIHQSLQAISSDSASVFKKNDNLASWSSIEGLENKLSLSLFYDNIQKLWKKFWILTSVTTIPIIIMLLIEIISPQLSSSISTKSKHIPSETATEIFIPFNTIITFVRIFYNVCEFVFMSTYFQFICDCHRGDLLIHLHYYDTTNITYTMNEYFNLMEIRLASIIWDWDRIVAATRSTSNAFRWWILVMIILNFIAGVIAIVNLSLIDYTNGVPQHLEMYLPTIVNLIVSFYILLIGTKLSHIQKKVERRTYFLLANTHFGNVKILNMDNMDDNNNNNIAIEDDIEIGIDGSMNSVAADHDNKQIKKDSNVIDSKYKLIKQQNLYIQSQTVANAIQMKTVGISVYGLVLNRNLFLAFFSPFVAFLLFCLNTWLPGGN